MRLRLGVAGGPVPRLPADLDEPLARQLAGLGVRVLTTHFQPTPEAVAKDASRVRSVLADHGISIVQATGYNPQLTHPDDAGAGNGARTPAGRVRHRPPARLRNDHQRLRVASPEPLLRPAPGQPHAGHARASDQQPAPGRPVGRGRGRHPGPGVPRHHRARHPRAHPRGHPGRRFAVGARQLRPRQPARRFPAGLAQRRRDAPHVANPRRLLREVRPHQRRGRRRRVSSSTSPKPPPGHGHLDLDAFFEVVTHLGEDTAVIVEHLPADQALAAIAYVKHAAEQRGFTFPGWR